jgi:zinc protease
MIRKALLIMCISLNFSAGVASTTLTWAEPLARKTILPNGLTLIVSERNQLPTIHLQAMIRAGSTQDPPEIPGLANLTAELLTQGTAQRSATQMNREIESVGGSLSATCEMDYSAVGLSILKKDLPLGLSILADVLLNPLFAPSEVDRKVSEMKARLKRIDEDPRQVAQLAFSKKLFGNHPYGHPTEGTLAGLSVAAGEDITRFFKTYYRPDNTSIVMVGQISLEEGVRLIEPLFNKWKSAPVVRPVLPSTPNLTGPVIEKIDRPISQANIIWGHLGISRSNPDFYALQVMNYVLGGGGFVSRLVDNIRDNLGLTYGIYSHFDAREYPGSFQIAVETKNQNANLALFEILKEVKKLIEKGVSQSELSEARAYLTGSFPLRMDTNAKMVRLLSAMEMYGLGLDFPQKYAGLINQVTTEDILRVAHKYLKPDQFLLVVVGNQKEIQLNEKMEFEFRSLK